MMRRVFGKQPRVGQNKIAEPHRVLTDGHSSDTTRTNGDIKSSVGHLARASCRATGPSPCLGSAGQRAGEAVDSRLRTLPGDEQGEKKVAERREGREMQMADGRRQMPWCPHPDRASSHLMTSPPFSSWIKALGCEGEGSASCSTAMMAKNHLSSLYRSGDSAVIVKPESSCQASKLQPGLAIAATQNLLKDQD